MSQDQTPIGDAVAEAVESGEFGAADAAVVALASRYAFELDTAYAAEQLWESVTPETPDEWRRWRALETKVRSATVVAEVGPKLLAVLDALLLSPAARAKLAKGAPITAPPEKSAPESALDALMDEHDDELAARRGLRG